MRLLLRQYGLVSAWVVSIVALCGSLTFSQILLWTPCELCWFERIFMYPQVVLLGIATFKKDRAIFPYSASLAALGGLISAYHILVENFPGLDGVIDCSRVGVSCSTEYIDWFGFITIPLLALVAFVLIVVLQWFSLRIDRQFQAKIK